MPSRSTHLIYRIILSVHVFPPSYSVAEINSDSFSTQGHPSLSMYDGRECSPEEAFRDFATRSKHSLAGVLGIDSGDCEDLYLPVRYKEEHDLHASIYFDDYGKQDRNAARELLFETAQNRGWLYLHL